MKVYAHHDSAGSIRSLIVVNSPEGGGMMLTPQPGEFATEIEGLTLKSNPPTPEELSEIAGTHIVAAGATRAALKKKP